CGSAPDGKACGQYAGYPESASQRILRHGQALGDRLGLSGLSGCPAAARGLWLSEGLPPGALGAGYPRTSNFGRNQRDHARDHCTADSRERSRHQMINDSDSVLFEVLTTGRLQVGVATLNRPRTLNGLTLPMCELLYDKLLAWANDPSIAFVILTGAGEKASCAGGDLHGIYESILQNETGHAWDNPYTRRFFDVEYRLDYLIHDYPKPLVCWGNGIVMGGGVGLMAGASHRVVSETTRFAMPEISIGLFPDVGGTWLLSRLPGGIGRFLALTGAQLGAADCLFLGLADHALESGRWPEFLEAVRAASWHDESHDNAVQLDNLLKRMALAIDAEGPLRTHYDSIRAACDGHDFHAVCDAMAQFAHHDDPWLQKAAATFKAGSPG